MMNAKMCQVIRELRDVGPATRPELAATLDVSHNTLWPWIAMLAAWGLIRPCGHKGNSVIFELAPPQTPLGTPYVRKGTHSKRLDKSPSS